MTTIWLDDWLTQTSTGSGDPTRRAISDVHKQCSDTGQELVHEASLRGWHVVETDTHYVIIPSGTMKVRC
jgi:hypothetical protein